MVLTQLLKQENRIFFFTAFSAALLIAATEPRSGQNVGLIGTYFYWVSRILIEAFLFFAIRDVVERYLLPNASRVMTGLVAIVLSLIPFVLAITAFDLILGFPERGLNEAAIAEKGRLVEFALELLYLSDNHFALCLLLSATRLFKLSVINQTSETDTENGLSFLQTLDPKLDGDILWITAQEHYVKIATTKETRTVLYRFSDLVRDLQSHPGMQIHRSHWVAYEAITKIEKSGQAMKVTLSSGDILPVSRTYRTQLEALMAKTGLVSS